MKALRSLAVAVATLAVWCSFPARAEVVPAGVVTALEGRVTVARAAAPHPVALKFRDGVFPQDRITTEERAVARLLLGGKAAVTVRERSVLTVADLRGQTTIGVPDGTVGLAVLRERLRPGEQIEIRTPNVMVAVQGAVGVFVVRPGPIVETVLVSVRGPFLARVGSRAITVETGQILTVVETVPVLDAAPAPVLADAVRVFQPVGLQPRQAVNAQELKELTAGPLGSGETSAAVVGDGEADLTENIRATVTEEAIRRYLVPPLTVTRP
jgi:hypothetical protein